PRPCTRGAMKDDFETCWPRDLTRNQGTVLPERPKDYFDSRRVPKLRSGWYVVRAAPIGIESALARWPPPACPADWHWVGLHRQYPTDSCWAECGSSRGAFRPRDSDIQTTSQHLHFATGRHFDSFTES